MIRLNGFTCFFVAAAVTLSWLAMTALHELGHVVNAVLSDGQVVAVELPPRGLGHTRVSPNPHPGFVAWGGACWGSLLGGAAILLTPKNECWRWFARFFAGTCLIANGVYLGLGGFFGDRNGADDAHELLRQGASLPQLVLFGVVTSGAGLLIWHRLGARLGFIRASALADGKIPAVFVALIATLLALGCVLG